MNCLLKALAMSLGLMCVLSLNVMELLSFSSVFTITDRRDIGLYDVSMLMSLLGLGIGMMLASFHT